MNKNAEKMREAARGLDGGKDKIYETISVFSEQIKQKNMEKERIQAQLKNIEGERDELVSYESQFHHQ